MLGHTGLGKKENRVLRRFLRGLMEQLENEYEQLENEHEQLGNP